MTDAAATAAARTRRNGSTTRAPGDAPGALPAGPVQAAVLASIANAVMVTDADGRIVWVNGAFTTLSGYEPDEARGHTPRLLKSGVQNPEHYTQLWATITAGEVWHGEVVNRHKDGHHYRVAQTITPVFDGDASPTHFVAIHDDITEQRRAEDEQRFQAQLLEAVGDAVIATDLDGLVMYANPAAEQMFGWRELDVLQAEVTGLVVSPAALGAFERILDEVREGTVRTGRIELQRFDGSRFASLTTISPYHDPNGRIAGFIGVAVDISEQVANEEQLRLRSQQQTMLSELGQKALDHGDAYAVAIDAVRQAADLLGPDIEVTVVWDGDTEPAPTGADAIDVVIDTARGFRLTGPGVERAAAQDIAFIRSLAHVVRATSQRAGTLAQLEHQATHDAVTGLPNRVLLLDRLDQIRAASVRSESRYTLLLLDLDDFKSINDSVGHHLGDEILHALAERLSSVVRPVDTVARLGGDEFAVVCPDLASKAGAEAVAERIQAALGVGVVTSDGPVTVTASIGIVFGDASTDPATVLRDADTAMHWAKDAGRNRAELFDARMQDLAVRRFETTNVLRTALDEERIVVEYQPSIELATGRIVGVEALARIRRDDGTLLSPIHFVPIAEQNGLIVQLGRQVLAQACDDARPWIAADRNFMLAVNLSPRQLTHPGITDDVQAALAANRLTPASLWLEITESALLSGPSAPTAIQQLRGLGVRFAIDDFGTGYSSLSHLRRTPVDMLKIDRSFVAGMHDDHQDHVLVVAVNELAASFGLPATAEGVETRQQAEDLSSLGCQYGQGFYWSPSVSAPEISRLLAAQAS